MFEMGYPNITVMLESRLIFIAVPKAYGLCEKLCWLVQYIVKRVVIGHQHLPKIIYFTHATGVACVRAIACL